jgi:hypothetical protein
MQNEMQNEQTPLLPSTSITAHELKDYEEGCSFSNERLQLQPSSHLYPSATNFSTVDDHGVIIESRVVSDGDYGAIATDHLKLSNNTVFGLRWQKQMQKVTKKSSFPSTKMTTINEAMLRNPNIFQAAALVRDAIMGVQPNSLRTSINALLLDIRTDTRHSTFALFCYRLMSFRPFSYVCYCCAWMLVVLTFIEPPFWCRNVNIDNTDMKHNSCEAVLTSSGIPASYDTNATAIGSTSSDIAEFYPNSYSMVVSETHSFWIEGFCTGFILFFVMVATCCQYLDWADTKIEQIWTKTLATQLICLVSIIVSLCFGYTKYNSIFRIVLLATVCNGAQRDIQVLLKILPVRPKHEHIVEFPFIS